MPMKNYYDHSFAELFHHPKFIRSLLFDFVDEPWVYLLDLNTMNIEEGEHKNMTGKALRNDLIVSFSYIDSRNTDEAPDFSIYLLMEFQSSREPMSLRLLEYLSRIYQKQSKAKLCPIVPIVVYNGLEPWSENPDLFSKFIFVPDSLQPYIPLYRYILIDEGRYDLSLLDRLKGALAAFFRIDTVDLTNRDAAAETIIGVLREMKEQDPEVFLLLSKYIEGLHVWRGIENNRIEEYINRRRKPMLAQRLDALREEGRREGYDEGILKDKQSVLMRLFEKKFSLEVEDEAVINSCKNLEKLDEALEVILFAEKKADVLEKLN